MTSLHVPNIHSNLQPWVNCFAVLTSAVPNCQRRLITETGEIIDKCIECDHVDKPECLMVDQITYTINRLLRHNGLQESDLLGIGIGCAGHIRFRDGVIITTSNLKGYKNYPLRDAVRAKFQCPRDP